MKKSFVTLAAVVVLSASSLPAAAAMGGCIPRPQAATGTDSSAVLSGAYAAVAALLGL